jgi:hypothetical protein
MAKRIHSVRQAHQGAGVEQIRGGVEGGHGVGHPGIAREAAILDLQAVVQTLVPQFRGVLEILTLQGLQLFWREFQGWRGSVATGFQTAQIDGLKMLHGLAPTFGQVLLKSFGHLGPEFGG